MKKNKIRIKTVLGYLKQKGWKQLYDTDNFHVLEAPAHFKFEPDPYFSIPLQSHEETDYYYDYMMDRFANLIAQVYELNKEDLIKTWSKTAKDFKADIKATQDLLNYVG